MIHGKSLVTTCPVGDVDHRRDGDAARVAGDACVVGLLEPVDAEHRVDAVAVEVEGPAVLVVHRRAQSHREDVLEPEQECAR